MIRLFLSDRVQRQPQSIRINAGIPEKQALLISGHKTGSIFDRHDICEERDIQNAGRNMAAYLAE